MERYSEYKDSGVEWLGEIPRHWELIKNKYLFSESDERNVFGEYKLLSFSKSKGIIPYDQNTDKESSAEDIRNYKVLHKGQLLENRLQAWNGMFQDSSVEGCVSPDYSVFNLIYSNANIKYYSYLFKTDLYIAQWANASKGIGSGFNRLYTPQFGNIVSLVPPIEEQNAIVAYLDKVTSKIDAAIAQQQKMIELLNERKQIIINNAVTKGLDPTAKMKPSGIPWLGNIPAHWEIIKYRYLFYYLDNLRQPITADKRSRNNPQYDYYGASGVIDKIDYYNVDDTVLLIGEDGANLLLRNLPLVYKAKGRFWVNNHAHILKPKRDDYDYLAYAMEAADYTLFITGSAQPKLSQSNLNCVKLPIPPIEEQHTIVEYLKKRLEKIDDAINEKNKILGLLQERKQIIINEVVTGKVKVI